MAMYSGIILNGFVKSRSIDAARAKAYAWAKQQIFNSKLGCAGTQAKAQVTKDGKYTNYENVGSIEYGGTKDKWRIYWEVKDKENAKRPMSEWMVTRYDLSPNGKVSNGRRVRW